MGGCAALQGAERQRSAGGAHQLRCHASQHVQKGNTNVEQCQRMFPKDVKLKPYSKDFSDAPLCMLGNYANVS
ncbi:hypothetical protein JOQ06_003658 [Pogonophryne albipinna]|uniref:Uncharacterized protein n=1 Tax=Pogonophryne albipinna TaxID=1090488 RepID=A0AAD6AHB4_9TELE|nr:hypothetical protein JOQ06_003658 [Pogonophryne albipinna]